MLVVDASAFASWAFPDEGGDKVSQALIRVMTQEESASSPALFHVEALHAAGHDIALVVTGEDDPDGCARPGCHIFRSSRLPHRTCNT